MTRAALATHLPAARADDMDVMGEPGDSQPDLAAIADTFSVSKADIMNALGN